MEPAPTEQTLVEALRKGEPHAFEEVYRQYYRMVEDLVLRLNGTRNDAQDVFQEGLLVLVKKLREPGFRLTAKLSTYLYAINRNLWLKMNGKSGREVSYEPGDLGNFVFAENDPSPLTAEAEDALINTMNEKLQELEEGCRSVLMLAFYQQCSHAEIADRLGYAEAFVKVKKFRCLEYLRKLLKNTPPFKDR
jgi:RNA polymerase sigma factor (sigma-70 family)